jgi:transposase InsO family protein
MLEVIDQIREQTGMPYRTIADAVRLPYQNIARWRMRKREAMPLVRQPGPQKVITPDYGRLKHDIAGLSHGKSRTDGAGALYLRHASSVSRRELQGLIALARHDQNTKERQNLRRIHWNIPNVAWSMDPTEYDQRDEKNNKVHLNQMQDLASRYKFSPMAGSLPCGEEIAGYLTEVFRRLGPPLFLKRDNGGNLNHQAVNDVLSEHFVLPVNSPVHYPPYNGAIEQAQAELKNGLDSKLSYGPCCPTEHMEAYVWITGLQDAIVGSEGVQPQAAWRLAVETWLNMKGFITITINGKVLPGFL